MIFLKVAQSISNHSIARSTTVCDIMEVTRSILGHWLSDDVWTLKQTLLSTSRTRLAESSSAVALQLLTKPGQTDAKQWRVKTEESSFFIKEDHFLALEKISEFFVSSQDISNFYSCDLIELYIQVNGKQ